MRRELWRALAGAAALPFHAAHAGLHSASIRAAVRQDLAHTAAPSEGEPAALPTRPLRVFVSCAERSGETHAVGLVDALRRRAQAWGAPPPQFLGLGGARLDAAGVRTLGDPVARAAMGGEVLSSLGFYRELLGHAAGALENEAVDVCVPVDSPALHVPLGHIARGLGIPVVHYVTPQYWAWAPWRVRGYRGAVDLALTILPFEPSWFARHGVRTAHVGHPQQDVLAGVEAPPHAPAPGRTALVLLPGSRQGVLQRNAPFFRRVLELLSAQTPLPELVLPLADDSLRDSVAPMERDEHLGVRVSRAPLHEELARARVALSVSGTVLLDLLHHRIPTAVVYPAKSGLQRRLQGSVLTVPWFSSPNLLAGREVLPETTHHAGEPAARVARSLARWLTEPALHAETRRGLDEAAARLGPPGAAGRAATHVLRAAVGLLPPEPR